MAFGTLRGVVHSFGAHAAVLVKPLGGEVDGRQLRGRGEAKPRPMCRGALDAALQSINPAVALVRRRCAEVIATLRLRERQHELPVASF
jgi:hypothetical protein